MNKSSDRDRRWQRHRVRHRGAARGQVRQGQRGDLPHRHGEDVHLFDTEEAAFAELVSFVKEWWEGEMGGRKMPEDAKEAVEAYFAAMDGDEYYDIGRATLTLGGSARGAKKAERRMA